MAFLSARAQNDLIQFVAANGEGFGQYRTYAQSRGWPLFTEGSFKNWVQRRRDKVQAARRVHEAAVRRMSTLDKERRVEILEARVNEVNALLAHADDTKEIISLMETQRKLLQAVAQERGEWGRPVEENESNDAMASLIERMGRAARLLPDGNRTTIEPAPARVLEHEPA